MYIFLKIKKIAVKILTCWIFPKKYRKTARNFLFYFSFSDYLRFKKQDFHIISLGNNCLPRVLTTAAGIKPRKFYGEKTCPFDYTVMPDLKMITHFIENNFEDYFDKVIFDKKMFLHDYHLSRKDFEKRYNSRIKNFIELLNSDKMIYFIYSNFTDKLDKNELNELYKALSDKRREKPFHLIVLNSVHVDTENITQITRNFAIKDSCWVEYFINDYKNFDNEYTRFCENVGNDLRLFISNNHQKISH